MLLMIRGLKLVITSCDETDDLFCVLISIFGGVEVSLSPPRGGGFAIPSRTRGVNGGEFSPIPDDFKFVLYPNFVIKPKDSCGHSIEEFCRDWDSVAVVIIPPPSFIFVIFMLKNR